MNSRLQNGLTLLEIAVVIAVMATLLALSVPAYNNYIIRAEVSEALVTASPYKSTVALNAATVGVVPLNIDEQFSENASYTQAVRSFRSRDCPKFGGLELTMSKRRADPLIAGKQLRLYYLGEGQWACGQSQSSTIPKALLPAKCRHSAVAVSGANCDRKMAALRANFADIAESGKLSARGDWEDDGSTGAKDRNILTPEERLALEQKVRAAREQAAAEARAKQLAELESQRQAQLEAERQAKLEAQRQAQLEAERQARLEAQRQAQLEAERRAKLEAQRQAQLEAERRAKLEAKRRARREAMQR